MTHPHTLPSRCGQFESRQLGVAQADPVVQRAGEALPLEWTGGWGCGKPADATAKTRWAVVHGLALLLLGPMSGVPLAERPAVIDACSSVIGRGPAST